MQVAMLGTLEVWAGSGEVLEVGGSRLRALLIMLALRPGQVVPASELIDGLWADVAGTGFGPAIIARLGELRLAATEQRVDADLLTGVSEPLVAELEELVVAHPLREPLAARLMRALHASGRRADALEAYEQARERLADQLGPGRAGRGARRGMASRAGPRSPIRPRYPRPRWPRSACASRR